MYLWCRRKWRISLFFFFFFKFICLFRAFSFGLRIHETCQTVWQVFSVQWQCAREQARFTYSRVCKNRVYFRSWAVFLVGKESARAEASCGYFFLNPRHDSFWLTSEREYRKIWRLLRREKLRPSTESSGKIGHRSNDEEGREHEFVPSDAALLTPVSGASNLLASLKLSETNENPGDRTSDTKVRDRRLLFLRHSHVFELYTFENIDFSPGHTGK